MSYSVRPLLAHMLKHPQLVRKKSKQWWVISFSLTCAFHPFQSDACFALY